MELKLARESLKADSQSQNITFEEIAKIVDQNGKKGAVFYFDRDNTEKDIKKLESYFENKNRSILMRELHYSMDSKDYVYEIHIL